MNKKERKANEALKNAIEYVRRFQTQKLQPTHRLHLPPPSELHRSPNPSQ